MELTTIGAVLTFILEAERKTLTAIDRLSDEGLAAFRAAKMKHVKILEQTRRENTTEMILEPIRGLAEADFLFPESSSAGKENALIAVREEMAIKYLLKAAEAIPQRDVSRILTKMAREKENHLTGLGATRP